MIAVDVETSGISPQKNSILSIGAVDMSDPDNTFYGECRAWDGAEIQEEALAVNGFTMQQATDPLRMTEAELIIKFKEWVRSLKTNPLMCGMNVAFDRDFIREASNRAGIRTPFSYRTVDVHAVAWYYVTVNGARPPKNLSLNRIAEMVGAGREPDPHNALTGAMYAAECISRMLNNKSLLPQYFKK